MKAIESINCAECKAQKHSIFEGCNKDILDSLDAMKTCRIYKKGEEIFEEGKHPRGLLCVLNGKIKVYQKGVDGKEQIVHLIHDGNIMGHRALFGDDTYSCSAIALEDSKVCFLPKSEFQELITQNGKLTFKIAQLLADELKEAESNITSAAQQSVMDRIAKTLVNLQKHYGYLEDNKTLNIEIKREDLANMAGTTRETATRYLYDLQKEQLISLEGKKIKINNLSKLIELSL